MWPQEVKRRRSGLTRVLAGEAWQGIELPSPILSRVQSQKALATRGHLNYFSEARL